MQGKDRGEPCAPGVDLVRMLNQEEMREFEC